MSLFNSERPLETTILIYFIVLGLLFLVKPKFIFDPKGNLKQFATGSGPRKTVMPLWLFLSLIGVIIYYLVIVYNYRYQVNDLCTGIKNGSIKNFQEIFKNKCS
jgi:hypothetical protein